MGLWWYSEIFLLVIWATGASTLAELPKLVGMVDGQRLVMLLNAMDRTRVSQPAVLGCNGL